MLRASLAAAAERTASGLLAPFRAAHFDDARLRHAVSRRVTGHDDPSLPPLPPPPPPPHEDKDGGAAEPRTEGAGCAEDNSGHASAALVSGDVEGAAFYPDNGDAGSGGDGDGGDGGGERWTLVMHPEWAERLGRRLRLLQARPGSRVKQAPQKKRRRQRGVAGGGGVGDATTR